MRDLDVQPEQGLVQGVPANLGSFLPSREGTSGLRWTGLDTGFEHCLTPGTPTTLRLSLSQPLVSSAMAHASVARRRG